jgi:Arylsulfatase regulator (Fe-S oxidoreductase)
VRAELERSDDSGAATHGGSGAGLSGHDQAHRADLQPRLQILLLPREEKLFPSSENFKMSDAGLETYVRQSIKGQSVPEVSFAWQGGEPV